MEKKEKKCECNCGWCNTLWRVTMILVLITLVWGIALGTCMYKKVDSIYKIVVEMSYGSAENLNKIYDAVMTEDYKKQINEQVDAQLESMAASANTQDWENNLTNPSSEDWDDEADEAWTLFGLSWTPGNAIINTKTLMYKAVGGAYPQDSFEQAIAQVRDGSATTDDMGNAGYLTETQLAKLLDWAYFKDDNKDAEIILVEYSDLICPYCQRHYDNKTLESIIEEDSSIALVFKNMPLSFHPTADLGAKGVKCAGEVAGTKAYYDFLDKAFATAEADGQFTNESLTSIATELKIDTNKFESCLNA